MGVPERKRQSSIQRLEDMKVSIIKFLESSSSSISPLSPEQLEQGNAPDTNEWDGWMDLLKLCTQRWVFGIVIAIVVACVCLGLSKLPWTASDGTTGHDVYVESTYAAYFQAVFLSFGPIYFALNVTLMFGSQRIKESKVLYILLPTIIVSSFIWVVIFFGFNFNFWFYYLDMLGVVINYGPIAFLTVYKIVSVPYEGTTLSRKEAIRKALLFVTPDIIVSVMALVYMFLLMPIFFNFTEQSQQLLWRIFLHPIYFNITTSIARYFAYEDLRSSSTILNANLVLHAYFHHQTLGRVLVHTFSDPSGAAIMIVTSCIEGALMRIFVLKRDEICFRLFYSKEEAIKKANDPRVLTIRATIQNMMGSLEFSGLFTAPLFLYFFFPHHSLFHVYNVGLEGGYPASVLLWECCMGVVLDLFIDYFCTSIEIRWLKMPIKQTWTGIKTYKWFYLWLIYGSVTMGLMGMIWVCTRVPRYGLCADNRLCSCSTILRPIDMAPCY